ncbi:hypothetical protein EJB05_30361 [Eragrostis curvula]|uniref:J domain-containing protein n=1 Tax=Eragrostis curvula TaxID=38414 RepID=A0A5J9UAT6_9POAL|nr:hypothetical protein EJB05_30361 [Eragrostis curvula]
MAAASPLLSLPLLLLLLLIVLPASDAIYCDEDDCYDLLGLKQDANASEIRKAYYKLSLKHHPDKNPDPESRKLFVKIANAYEILKDESTREQYDYAIAHPEEVFYNTAQYYRAYYGHKTDPRAVLIGLLLIISAFQYINQLTRYNQAIESVKQTPAYRNRLKALEFERTGGIASKKKGHKQVDKKVEVELNNEVELQIHGVERPSVWRLFGVQFILLPYYIGKMLTWEICWLWRYRVKKLPYAWEDACYLTQTSLRMPANAWKNMGNYQFILHCVACYGWGLSDRCKSDALFAEEALADRVALFQYRLLRHTLSMSAHVAISSLYSTTIRMLFNDDSLLSATSISDESTKENLVSRRLWEKNNMERYIADMRKESKRRR